MSSNAIEAQGIVIQRGEGSGPTYTTIPEVKSFTGPGGSASVIDVTDLSSAAKEKRMGLADEGQLQLTINYLPDNEVHQDLRADRAARTRTPFRIVFTDDNVTQWDFDAFVTGFSVSGAVDGVVEAQVTLEITGAISESEAESA
jgi:predicted secreted protein